MRPIMLRCWRSWPLLLAVLFLSACSPQYNWREIHDEAGHFRVLLPAKPDTLTRHIDLDGMPLDMHMTAAEVDGITFAVGSALLNDAASAPAALKAIRSALLGNIGGTAQDTLLPGGHSQASAAVNTIDLVASGSARGQPLYLMARLQAKGQRIYQVVIISPGKAIASEQAEMLFSSFKPD